MTAQGAYEAGRPPIGARISVSSNSRRRVTWPLRTRNVRGTGPANASRRVVLTWYVPGASEREYAPVGAGP